MYVDGFNCALQLAKSDPEAFETLCTLTVSSHCAGDKGVFLQPTPTHFPILRRDGAGNVVQIRY